MNIFKVLSSNDGSINEPNVTSFLAYLLDPNENHGLGSRFVESFLTPIVLANNERYKDLIYNNRVRDLSRNSKYEVRVQAEVKVIRIESEVVKKTRDIDIVIELFDQNFSDIVPKYSFCVENKINDGAIQKGDNQLFDEIIGLVNYYKGSSLEKEQPLVAFIYLTHSGSQRAINEFNELLPTLEIEGLSVPCYHLFWGGEELERLEITLVDLLSRILKEETVGKIEPIYDYTKHTIKSFISFIYSGFKSYKEEKNLLVEKSDYGKPVIQYIKDFYDISSLEQDIAHDDLRNWVSNKVKEASGKTLKNANFDRSYIVNDRNRKHYGMNSPRKEEKNLFYYPDENNRKVIRKLDHTNPPKNVMIYWKDNNNPDSTGCALLTEIFVEAVK
ncbi:PD-(D/E)XK nuclease family protein [Niallia taxi]|uniref:PD-(D/E)XK nuclease family protein n=1 Tax=Niallia taxi TaxID=2499688 RepID=UPI0015F4953C|nr:PD-(D/E)XK nuclease family protein [Niallia taxi]